MPAGSRGRPERGTILVTVTLFVAIAIAALAAISSSRVISAAEHQRLLEHEAQATTGAYEKLELALNVVNSSAYADGIRNVELRDAIAGAHGGTAGGEPDAAETWLRDPDGILHGKVRGTDVRVYRARDYIRRLARLKGATPPPVDPKGLSSRYFVLESAGRAGDTVRLVSALVRENEPFSSFAFFQGRHPLGVSGSPRGLVHANDRVEFHFPHGDYLDPVSAVKGFAYAVGATPSNTTLAAANPAAQPIDLGRIDFASLAEGARLFRGADGLDARIELRADGRVRIDEFTPPRREQIERSWTGEMLVGFETRAIPETRQVRIGTVQEVRTRDVITGHETEAYFVDVPVYQTQVVTRTREEPVLGEREVEKVRQVPVYERRTVPRTRWVRAFVARDDERGNGVPGEWVWRPVAYACERDVLVRFRTETYTATERVRIGTRTVAYEEEVRVQVGTKRQQRTRKVPVSRTETYRVDVPVYEPRTVDVRREVPVYEAFTRWWTEPALIPPRLVDRHDVRLGRRAGVIYVDGRITGLHGDLRGRLTIVGNGSVRITGNIRYVDGEGDPAMRNGLDPSRPYVRNDAYDGNSALGIIARGDILFTDAMPPNAEINGTLLSASGRVGIDGFRIDDDGRPVPDPCHGLSTAARAREEAYAATLGGHATFLKNSLRRLGGIISHGRILETCIVPGGDGGSHVAAGFKRGTTRFDTNVIFNPPPNFAEVPRPVVTSIAPIYLVRNHDE